MFDLHVRLSWLKRFNYTLNFTFSFMPFTRQWPEHAYRTEEGTYYSAESFSWYSRERRKHAWMPGSRQSRFMTAPNSTLRIISSLLPATVNNCLASLWTNTTTRIIIYRFRFIELVARRLKIKKAKQTIVNCTIKQYNTVQEIKCNAMDKAEPRIVI